MVSMKRIDAAADAIVSLVDGTARPLLVSFHENILVSMKRIDAAADAIISLVDGTARPLLVSFHENILVSIGHADAAAGAATSLINGAAHPLLVSLHETLLKSFQKFMLSIEFAAYCIGFITIITVVITFYGIIRILVPRSHISDGIKNTAVSQTKPFEMAHMESMQDVIGHVPIKPVILATKLTWYFHTAGFSTHVLDFAELTASKGYEIIFVYHPSNRWHGAVRRAIKDSSRIQWHSIQTDACLLYFYNNSRQLVDKMQAVHRVTDEKDVKKAIAVIFPAGYSSFICNFRNIPSDLGPVHFFGQTDDLGLPCTWLPSEMNIDNTPLSSQSATIFNLGVRSLKEKASDSIQVARCIFDDDGRYITTKNSDNVHVV